MKEWKKPNFDDEEPKRCACGNYFKNELVEYSVFCG